jgi:hypothetical protein
MHPCCQPPTTPPRHANFRRSSIEGKLKVPEFVLLSQPLHVCKEKSSSLPTLLDCCDAGQGIFQDYPIPYLWGARMVRAFESVFRKAQNATQNRIHSFAAEDQIKGFVLAYLGQIDDRVPYAPCDLVMREEVFEYPTDFRAMHAEDIDPLAKRGEQLTRALIAYYCPDL